MVVAVSVKKYFKYFDNRFIKRFCNSPVAGVIMDSNKKNRSRLHYGIDIFIMNNTLTVASPNICYTSSIKSNNNSRIAKSFSDRVTF